MKNKNFHRLFFYLIAGSTLILSGCASFTLPPQQGAEIIRDGVPEYAALRSTPPFFKTLLSASTQVGDEKQSLRYAVISQDQKLRIEAFPTTSFYTLLLFKSDGEKFLFQNFTDNSTQEGVITDETLRGLLGITLSPTELRSVIVGVLPKSDSIRYRFFDAGTLLQAYGRSTDKKDDVVVYAEIIKATGLLSKEILLEDGEVRSEIAFVTFTNDKTPLQFSIEIPRFGAVTKVTERSLTFDGSAAVNAMQFLPLP